MKSLSFALGKTKKQKKLQINDKLQSKTSLLISCHSFSKIFYTTEQFKSPTSYYPKFVCLFDIGFFGHFGFEEKNKKNQTNSKLVDFQN